MRDKEGQALANDLGPGVIYENLDVTQASDWDAAIATAEAEFGGVNALFNNAGILGYGGLCAYVASKWGVRGPTKSAALDLAQGNIRVMSVHPGRIRTPMTEAISDEIAKMQPIPRFGEAAEVARMVRFLFTEASYSTGSEFTVDRGAVTGQILPMPTN